MMKRRISDGSFTMEDGEISGDVEYYPASSCDNRCPKPLLYL